jgi:hypothetical protein
MATAGRNSSTPLIGLKGFAPTNIRSSTHRVRTVRWDNNTCEQLLAATNERIILYRAIRSGATLTWEKQLLTRGRPADEAPVLDVNETAGSGVATAVFNVDRRSDIAAVESSSAKIK